MLRDKNFYFYLLETDKIRMTLRFPFFTNNYLRTFFTLRLFIASKINEITRVEIKKIYL